MSTQSTRADQKEALLQHVYRSAMVEHYCAVCQRPATYACPGCHQTFCLEHTTFIDRCPDCDLQLSQVEHRAVRIAMVAGGLLAAGLLVCWTTAVAGELTVAVLVGVSAAVLCVLVGWVFGCSLVGALWIRRRRRRLDGGASGPQLLRGATVPIAPEAPDTDPRLHRSVGYACNSAGALPEVPIWQRTFWR